MPLTRLQRLALQAFIENIVGTRYDADLTSRSRVAVSKPNRTTFIALVVLDDAIRNLQANGPLKQPQHGIRLALAYLYSTCLSKNRDPFDTLWLTLLGRDRQPPDFRVTWAGTQFARICQDIGVRQDIELGKAMARLRADKPATSS